MVDQLWLFILGKGSPSHIATELNRKLTFLRPRRDVLPGTVGTKHQRSLECAGWHHGGDERKDPASDSISLRSRHPDFVAMLWK